MAKVLSLKTDKEVPEYTGLIQRSSMTTDLDECRLISVGELLACENAMALFLGTIRAYQRKLDEMNNEATELARQITEMRYRIRAKREL